MRDYSYGPYFGEGLEAEKQILYKYRDNIDSVFFSYPVDYIKSDRNPDFSSFSPPSIKLVQKYYNFNYDALKKDYYSLISYARSLGMKINLTFNRPGLRNKDLDKLKALLDDVQPEEICCHPYNLQWFKDNYKPDFYSVKTFFSGDWPKEECERPIYDCYVLKHRHLIDSIVPTRQNRILINQSCPDICHGCNITGNNRNFNHVDFIDKEGLDLETYMARHLWGPEDIENCKKCFPNMDYCWKISSRMPNPRELVDKYIDLLLNGSIVDILTNDETLLVLATVYIGLRIDNGEGIVSAASKILHKHFEENFRNWDWGKFKEEKIKWWQQISANITTYNDIIK